jgi:hypothetical protein
VDILIPLGLGTAWQNNELRYCLRSIEKFATGFDRIFIVGDDPGFLNCRGSRAGCAGDTPVICFHPCADIERNKQARIAHKIFWTFQETDISDDAVLFNDDYVLNEPVDLRRLLPYHRGSLAAAAVRQDDPCYKACLIETLEALEAAGKPSLHYDIHVPTILRRAEFLALDTWWQRSYRSKNGLVVKSTYANNTLPVPGPFIRDCKFRHHYSAEDINSFTRGRFVFSYCDEGLTPIMKELLCQRFPARCQWEKNGARMP